MKKSALKDLDLETLSPGYLVSKIRELLRREHLLLSKAAMLEEENQKLAENLLFYQRHYQYDTVIKQRVHMWMDRVRYSMEDF